MARGIGVVPLADHKRESRPNRWGWSGRLYSTIARLVWPRGDNQLAGPINLVGHCAHFGATTWSPARRRKQLSTSHEFLQAPILPNAGVRGYASAVRRASWLDSGRTASRQSPVQA